MPWIRRTPVRHFVCLTGFALALLAGLRADDASARQGARAKRNEKSTPLPARGPLDYDPRRAERMSADARPLVGNLIGNKFNDAEFRIRLKLASRTLDEWSKRVEEYGSVTMSAPILTREQEGFQFNIKEDAQSLFESAKSRKDGSASASLAIVNQLSLAAEGSFDPLARAQLAANLTNYNSQQAAFTEQSRANADAQFSKNRAAAITRDAALEAAKKAATPAERATQEAKAYSDYAAAAKSSEVAEPAQAAGTAPAAQFATTNDRTAQTAKANIDELNDPQKNFFKTVAGLADTEHLKATNAPGLLPDRVAMIDAAGTNTVKAIFQVLGHPEEAMKFKDKAVLFATVAVGVNPGWRTRQDFAAEITGQASYRLARARSDVVLALALANRLAPEDKSKLRDDLLERHGVLKAYQDQSAKKTAVNHDAKIAALDRQIDALNDELALTAEKIGNARRQEQECTARAAEFERRVKYNREVLIPPLARQVEKSATASLQETGRLKALLSARKNYMTRIDHLDTAEAARASLPPGLEVPEDKVVQAVDENVQQLEKLNGIARSLTDPAAGVSLTDAVAGLDQTRVELWATQTASEKAAPSPAPKPIPFAPGLLEKAEELRMQAEMTSNFGARSIAEKTEAGRAGQRVSVSESDQKRDTAKVANLQQERMQMSLFSGNFGPGESGGDSGFLSPRDQYFDKIALDKQVPLVAGISPLMETQVLDLKDSFGRQDQIALALAATLRQRGLKGSAQLFERYMKQQTKVAATLSSLPVVNTFSASGGLFGFQVGPRLRALKDPAARKGGSANVLDRQSFPAVLIVGLDRADLTPVICKAHDEKLWVFEPQLVIRQSSRWNPLDRKLFSFSKNDWWNPLDWHNPRYSERDRADNLMNTADQFRDLELWLQEENHRSFHAAGQERQGGSGKSFAADDASTFTRHPYAEVVDSLVRRRDALHELSAGSESRQYLPQAVLLKTEDAPKSPEEPLVTDIVPPSINAPAPAGPPAGNASRIAVEKAAFDGQVLQYQGWQSVALQAATNAAAKIAAILASETELKALVAKTIPEPVPPATKRSATAQELDVMRQRLRGLTAPVSGLKAALVDVNVWITAIQTVLNKGAAAKAEEMATLPESLEQAQVFLQNAAGGLPEMPAEIAPVLSEAGIERSTMADNATRTAAEIPRLAASARLVRGLLQNGPQSAFVTFAILGKNLENVIAMAASEDASIIEWVQPGIDRRDGIRTVKTKDAILVQARLRQSCTLHFQLTFQVPDPLRPKNFLTRRLFSPPVTLTFGGGAPLIRGQGYFDMNGQPVREAALLRPASPPAVEAVKKPEVRRMALRPDEADFSTELFPPLPEK